VTLIGTTRSLECVAYNGGAAACSPAPYIDSHAMEEDEYITAWELTFWAQMTEEKVSG